MEPLHRRSDGIAETPSGLFAIVPRYASGRSGNLSWFEFKADVFATATRVEWPSESPFILIEQPTALAMVRLQYAHNISDELLDRYNLAREEWLKEQPAPEPTPAAPAAPPVLLLTDPPQVANPDATAPVVATEPSPPGPEWTPPAVTEPPVAPPAGNGNNAPSSGKGRRG